MEQSHSHVPGINPAFQAFYETPLARRLADNKRWTVTMVTQNGRKMPLDIHRLLDYTQFEGAMTHDETSLTDLHEIYRRIPLTNTFTYYLSADIDNLVILDIEPECPDELKEKLVSMPCLYAETSMSGKGIHMIFPYPYEILEKYPNAKSKIVLKEKSKAYEILMEHYVTFTGHAIPYRYDETCGKFKELFESLARDQKQTTEKGIVIDRIEGIDTKYITDIFNVMDMSAKRYPKTPADYGNDMSVYEFNYMLHLYRNLNELIKLNHIKKEHTYTESEQAWILYQIASSHFPYRDKHETTRDNMPWLYHLAWQVMNKIDLDEKKTKAEKKE